MPRPGFTSSTSKQHNSASSGKTGAARADTKRTVEPSLAGHNPQTAQIQHDPSLMEQKAQHSPI